MVQSSRPVVFVVACCYNEARILPFFLDHYVKFIGATRVILYDGGSSDGSAEIAARYPEVVFKVERSEKLDDRDLLRIRNEEWKNYRTECDWMIVCDVDEFLYCPDPAARFEELKKAGITLPSVEGYVMYSKSFPRHEADRFLWQEVQTGIADPRYGNKNLIFDPAIDINYQIGCHSCSPTGPVKRSDEFVFKNLHYSMLSYDAIVGKSRMVVARLSEWNEQTGAGFHRKSNAAMARQDFNRLFFNAANVIQPVTPPATVTPAMHTIVRLLLDADREAHILELDSRAGSGVATAFYAWFVHNFGGRFLSMGGDAKAVRKAKQALGTLGEDATHVALAAGSAVDVRVVDERQWDVVHIGDCSRKDESTRETAIRTLDEFIRVEDQLAPEALVVADAAVGAEGPLQYLGYYLLGRGYQGFTVGAATLFSRRNLAGAS